MNEQENSVNKRDYSKELLEIVRSQLPPEKKKEELTNYHESDIAEILPKLSKEERLHLYHVLGTETVSEIFTYLDDVEDFVEELGNEKVADILEEMDANEAIDVLEELDENTREEIIKLLDDEVANDIKLIDKFDESVIGSRMSTNFIVIQNNLSVAEATKSVIKQASDNDNISTIYAIDENQKYYGAIDLRDLIIARKNTPLSDVISTAYPFLYADEPIEECIEKIKEYYEDSIPVLDRDNKVIGVITSSEIVDVVSEELEEDYAKLAGLTAQEDLEEPLLKSLQKRLPWLVSLMAMGLIVSTLIGSFSGVLKLLPILVCFQSLILDMSGNTGTQSLAVTIRVISNETLKGSEKIKLIFKELRVALLNGLILGSIATLICAVYINFVIGKSYDIIGFFPSLKVASCIGLALLVAMITSGLSGTVIPMIFKKIKIDPAVASGPLLTTINDLIAASVFYGISWMILIRFFPVF